MLRSSQCSQNAFTSTCVAPLSLRMDSKAAYELPRTSISVPNTSNDISAGVRRPSADRSTMLLCSLSSGFLQGLCRAGGGDAISFALAGPRRTGDPMDIAIPRTLDQWNAAGVEYLPGHLGIEFVTVEPQE